MHTVENCYISKPKQFY